MPERTEITFQIDNARVMFKNFSGEKTQYNREGDRNFCVVIPDDMVVKLENDGWNVKWLEPREEGDLPTPYIQVAVAYKVKPPRIVLVKSNGQQNLTEETVSVLDFADVSNYDLIIRAYEWEVNDKTGIKAYLKTLYATVQEDELERRYSSNEVKNG